jgi:crotonobetainyl-CoA:carnitine CoA-transferase CaiB-like acyl-CoA transferase
MSDILEGIKVIEMGQVIAIPTTGAILSDMGAEVIKLEPLSGEMLRGIKRCQGLETGPVNWVFELLNRNKKGLALDLKKDAGRDILYRLIRTADVFMSNYESSALQKLKLDYASLSKINPKLVYASINGYGSAGPDRDERGYDQAAAWARSGMMYLIGEPGSTPVLQREGMMDNVAGTHVATGILAALLHRERTGKGQEVSTSLYHCGVWTISGDIQKALGGQVPVKTLRTKAQNPLSNNYLTKDDRWICLANLQSDPVWPGFCLSIGKPELQNDPRFASFAKRAQNCEELIRIVDGALASKNLDDWIVAFRKNNVICGRVQTPAEVVNDPQAVANDFFSEIDHTETGKIKLINTPVKFYPDSGSVKTAAPQVGQHTEEILLGIGYTWEDLSRLKDERVIP